MFRAGLPLVNVVLLASFSDYFLIVSYRIMTALYMLSNKLLLCITKPI